jgi:DNA-3-methyladenine glycosylase II
MRKTMIVSPFDQSEEVVRAQEYLCGADPRLAELISAIGAFRLQRESQGFHTLIDAIVSQQISVKAANTVMKRIVAHVGELHPEALLGYTPESLRALGVSNQKAAYMLDLASHVASGKLDLDQLCQLDDESVIKQLVQVKGIGRWTAEMYLIFSLGRPDVLPVADLGVQQAVQRIYGLEKLPKAAEIRSIAEPWRPYRSMATWYLWRSINNTPIQ